MGQFKYLRDREWIMGNGQCPDCRGLGPRWLGFGGWGDEIGHAHSCSLVAALRAAGDKGPCLMRTRIARRYRRLDLSDSTTRKVWKQWSGRLEGTTEEPETEEQRVARERDEREQDAQNLRWAQSLLRIITKDEPPDSPLRQALGDADENAT